MEGLMFMQIWSVALYLIGWDQLSLHNLIWECQFLCDVWEEGQYLQGCYVIASLSVGLLLVWFRYQYIYQSDAPGLNVPFVHWFNRVFLWYENKFQELEGGGRWWVLFFLYPCFSLLMISICWKLHWDICGLSIALLAIFPWHVFHPLIWANTSVKENYGFYCSSLIWFCI